VDNIAAQNIRLNRAPIPKVPNLFNPSNNITSHFTMESHDGMSVDNKDSKESSTQLATKLQQYIDAHIGSQPEKAAACNAPEPIFHAANFLHSLFEFKGTKLSGDKQAQETDSCRAANNQFEALLGIGCASFTVPKEDCRQTPSPNYHSIEGTNIYYLDCRLIFPEATLKCYDCGSALTIGHNQFKKQIKPLLILEDGGLVSW
jgi:hypothetical protein